MDRETGSGYLAMSNGIDRVVFDMDQMLNIVERSFSVVLGLSEEGWHWLAQAKSLLKVLQFWNVY